MIDVFLYEAFEEEAERIRAAADGICRVQMIWQTIQESGHRCPPAPLISVRTQSTIPPEWAGSLTAILSRSTGYDHLLAYREQVGSAQCPQLGYLPFYCNRAVAEQAAMLWMALLRRLPRQMQHMNTFHRDGITGAECAGKTLAVVGVGNIGYEVARIGRGLDMEVLGVDLVQRHPDVSYVAPDFALRSADVVACCMNLTPQSHRYFDAERLRRMKRGAVFVNVARGELSPARFLLPAVRDGQLGGVALDVYCDETELAGALRSGTPTESLEVAAICELRNLDNVILTPHNAFNTAEAVERKARQSVEQIQRLLTTGTFTWPVP